jgi:hypothetical protein
LGGELKALIALIFFVQHVDAENVVNVQIGVGFLKVFLVLQAEDGEFAVVADFGENADDINFPTGLGLDDYCKVY